MPKIHQLGFPRVGHQRALKFALEDYWQGRIDQNTLLNKAQEIRAQNWQSQTYLDFATVGDFSLYDQVLDTSFLLGHIPTRAQGKTLDQYFQIARGQSGNSCCITQCKYFRIQIIFGSVEVDSDAFNVAGRR